MGMIELTTFTFPKEWKNLENMDDNNPNFKINKISEKGMIQFFIL